MSLEKFAKAARRRLHESVRFSIEHVLQADTAQIRAQEKAIRQLKEEIAGSSKEQVVERVAYTWFNRFCAFRYMDLQGFNKVRVVSPSEGGIQPEILQEAKQGYIDEDIVSSETAQRVRDVLGGKISSDDPEQEAYKLLLVAVCNHYHDPMPFMFERISDYTELLLPGDLLSQSSIMQELREAMDEEACESIEVIGWLYQYYIAEKKDEVIGKVVKSEDIPAATQLFTPNWIVKYMVQNSLGAQWLATYPDSPLKGKMEYYIEPAEQTEEVQRRLDEITPESLNPEEITLMDPACGSGHILVEAYDLFKAIYLERGFSPREIPQLIVEKNLFGLDIDERAAQLSCFALMMKGRADDRRFFDRGVQSNVMALEETSGINKTDFIARIVGAGHSNITGFEKQDLFPESNKQLELQTARREERSDEVELRTVLDLLVDTFEHAKTFGSLIRVPEKLAACLPTLVEASKSTSSDLFVSESLKQLKQLVWQTELLAARYDNVVANPPYMGSGGMNALMKRFAKDKYSDWKSDLYSCFIRRGCRFAKDSGRSAMITMHSWMFLSSFEKMRRRVLTENSIHTMAHLGPRAFGSISGEVVQTTSFILLNKYINGYNTAFINLVDGNEGDKERRLLEGRQRIDVAIAGPKGIANIPGSPIAYWVSPLFLAHYEDFTPVSSIALPRVGCQTSDNNQFLRMWYEVSKSRSSFFGGDKWLPYYKGGSFRRWFGNRDLVINWEDDGHEVIELATELYKSPTRTVKNQAYYFREGITWSTLSSDLLSFRHMPSGGIFDTKGSACFSKTNQDLELALGLLNSKVAQSFIGLTSPTLDYSTSSVGNIPLARPADEISTTTLVELTKADWNAFERSWDFQSSPLMRAPSGRKPTLEARYRAWASRSRETILEVKHLEEENNRLFIDAYGLQDELTPEVKIEQITLTVNPAHRYGEKLTEEEQWERFCQDTMKELVSYAVGCMFGRYSLDKPGLILANQGDTEAEYLVQVPEPSFEPDEDNVIPILDGEWFVDDAAKRVEAFLKVAFGEEHFAENLAFLEEGLGRDLRSYFIRDFYKDHVQTYKKRPIYWLFSSPKGTFNALIYMHRYRSDAVSVILNDYLRPFKAKLEAKAASLEQLSNNPSASQRDRTKALKDQDKLAKQISELEEYESEILYPLATEQIEIDLDDGVKANYPKFGKALKKVAGLS